MMAQAGSDTMTAIWSTAKDTVKTLGLARLTKGVGTAIHATMGEIAESSAAPILRVYGYEHTCQGRVTFPVKVLSESQLALRTYTFDDTRTAITSADLRQQVYSLAMVFSQTALPAGSAFYEDGYADIRVAVPIPTKAPRCPAFTYHKIGEAPPSSRQAPGLNITNAFTLDSDDEEELYPFVARPRGRPSVVDQLKTAMGSACTGFCPAFGASARHIASQTVGAGRLRVVHCRVPISIHCKLLKLAQSTVYGTEKRVPAYLFGKPATLVAAYVEDLRDRKLPLPTVGEEAVMVQIVMTALMAMIVESSLHGVSVYELLHVESHTPYVKTGESGAGLSDVIDQHNSLMREKYGDMELALPLRPATDVNGELPLEGLVVALDEHELCVWTERAHQQQAGAVVTGPNLFGKAPPLDTKHPVSMVSGVVRHFCNVTVSLDAGGRSGEARYDFTLRKGPRSMDLTQLQGVLMDLAELQIEAGAWCTLDGLVNLVIGDNGPGSMSQEAFEEALRMDGIRNLGEDPVSTFMGNCFNKAGEDGERARFVTMPGVAGREALHQARTAPVIKSFEEVHKSAFNHCHIKGLNDAAKRADFGEMLANCPKDWVALSYDKKANDRCWTEGHWAAMCEYYHKCAVAFWWGDFVALFNLTVGELEHHTELRLKHLFGVFIFKVYMILLLSGIGPTSAFNRTMSEAEEGLIVRTIWGETAYHKWLEQRRNAPVAKNTYWDTAEWKYAVKRTHRFGPDNNVCAKNEGDDKTLLARLTIQGEKEGTTVKVTPDELNEMIVSVAGELAGFAYELARVPNQANNCGRKAILEFCSGVIGISRDAKPETAVAYIVPKPLKALGKVAWSATTAVNFDTDPISGLRTGVVRDSTYHRFCATRFFSIAIGNADSPGVGKVLHNCGEMHWRAYIDMTGEAPRQARTLYDRRAPEARKLEEWEDSTFEGLNDLRLASASKTIERVFEPEDCYVAAVAWQMDLPALANKPMEQLIASLLTFDESAVMWMPSMEDINRPERFYEAMELGILGPELIKRTDSKYRALIAALEKPVESPEEVVDRVKAFLRPITKQKTVVSALEEAPTASGPTGTDKPATAPVEPTESGKPGWTEVKSKRTLKAEKPSAPAKGKGKQPKGEGKGSKGGKSAGKSTIAAGGKGKQRANGHPRAAGKGSK